MSDLLTTIVVKFEGSASADTVSVQYEGDPTRNIGSDGAELTSFTVDDDYYFLIHFSGRGRLSKVVSSAGQVFPLGSEQQSREQYLDFVEANSKDYAPSLSYLPAGALSQYWVGNTGTGMFVDPAELKVQVTGGEIPCKCLTTYPVTFFVFKLQPPRPMVFPPGKDTYDILIAIHVEDS